MSNSSPVTQKAHVAEYAGWQALVSPMPIPYTVYSTGTVRFLPNLTLYWQPVKESVHVD